MAKNNKPAEPLPVTATEPQPDVDSTAAQPAAVAVLTATKIREALAIKGSLVTYPVDTPAGMRTISRVIAGDAKKLWYCIGQKIKITDVTICESERTNEVTGEVRPVIELTLHTADGTLYQSPSPWAFVCYMGLCRLLQRKDLVGTTVVPIKISNPVTNRERLAIILAEPEE